MLDPDHDQKIAAYELVRAKEMFDLWFPNKLTTDVYIRHVFEPWRRNRMVFLDIPKFGEMYFTWNRLNRYQVQRRISGEKIEAASWAEFQPKEGDTEGLLWIMGLATAGVFPPRVYVPEVVRWFLDTGTGKEGERLCWRRGAKPGARYGSLKLRRRHTTRIR